MGANPRIQESKGRQAAGRPRATRASASLPPDIYQALQDIAKQKKVSFAWVIRDAAEKYVAEQWPLLERQVSTGHQEAGRSPHSKGAV